VREQETLDQLAEAYWSAAALGLHGGRRKPKRQVSIANDRHLWRRHIQSSLGRKGLAELKRSDVKDFMRSLVSEKGLAAASAASIGGLLHGILAFAVQEEKLDSNPVTGLARPLALTARDRLFDDASLRVVWDLARDAEKPRIPGTNTLGVNARPEPVVGLAMQFLILTLTRRNEVAGARKSEFDLAAGLWVIPADRAKADHQHVVPLSPLALATLERAVALDPDSPYVFPSPRVADRSVDPAAITRAVARICERHDLPHRSPHDIRRTGATILTGRFGVRRFIVGLVLGHTPNDGAAVTSVYDRHTYVPEKRDALLKWASHLTKGDKPDECTAPAVPAPEDFRTNDGLASWKSQALKLCEDSQLHQAVLMMCMAASREGKLSSIHLTLLSEAGTRFASKDDSISLQGWIKGFDG